MGTLREHSNFNPSFATASAPPRSVTRPFRSRPRHRALAAATPTAPRRPRASPCAGARSRLSAVSHWAATRRSGGGASHHGCSYTRNTPSDHADHRYSVRPTPITRCSFLRRRGPRRSREQPHAARQRGGGGDSRPRLRMPRSAFPTAFCSSCGGIASASGCALTYAAMNAAIASTTSSCSTITYDATSSASVGAAAHGEGGGGGAAL